MVISETHPSHSASAHYGAHNRGRGATPKPSVAVGGSEGASIAINGNHLPIIEVEERRRGMGSWDPRLGSLESRRPRARTCGQVRARRGEHLHAAPAATSAYGDRAISGNQWQSVAIRGHQRVRGQSNQWQSVAIGGNQWQSVAISGNQWPRARTGTEQCCRSADVRRVQPLVARSVPVGKGAPW